MTTLLERTSLYRWMEYRDECVENDHRVGEIKIEEYKEEIESEINKQYRGHYDC